MSRENVEAIRKSFEAWNRGDAERWLDGAHPDVEWFSDLAGQMEGSEAVFRGLDGLQRFWDEWHAVWDLHIEVEEIRDLGDTVLTLGRIHTRGKASGVDLEQPIAYVGEFEDGLLRRIRSYLDPSEALAALRLSE